MKNNFQNKKNKITYFILFCFLLIASGIVAQVTYTQVDPESNLFTIANLGSSSVDLTNYQLCRGTGTQVRIGTLTPISGAINLAPEGNLVLSYNMNSVNDGLSLFSTNSFG